MHAHIPTYYIAFLYAYQNNFRQLKPLQGSQFEQLKLSMNID